MATKTKKTEGEESAGSSLERMLGILNLFSDHAMVVTADEVVRETGCSRATAYRYLKCLSGSGLLSAAYGEGYGVGPRVVELDRLLRIQDPLVCEAREVMKVASKATKLNLMLCGYYGDKVMCLHTEWSDPRIQSSYERGRPMPMFLGATAKSILAHLSPYQQRNLMLKHADEIRAAGLGADWDEFRANLLRIRREEVTVSYGEIDPGLAGIGAPIFASEHRVVGSMVAIASMEKAKGASLERIKKAVAEAAHMVSVRLSKDT